MQALSFTPGNCYEDAPNGNKSAIHWDLVLIMTPEYGGGEIWFDDVLIRKDGRFLLPELECLTRKSEIRQMEKGYPKHHASGILFLIFDFKSDFYFKILIKILNIIKYSHDFIKKIFSYVLWQLIYPSNDNSSRRFRLP